MKESINIGKIKDKIKHSKVLAWIYGQNEDFNHGRAFFGKFTDFSNEITLGIVFTTQVLGINLIQHKVETVITVLVLLILVYLFGKIYRRSNLLEVDKRAEANRHPVNKLKLEAAEIIVDRFKKRKYEE